MIPYEELAAALESQSGAAPARVPSLGTSTLQEMGHEPSALPEPAHLEDPTLNGREQDPAPELELGDVLSDDEAS